MASDPIPEPLAHQEVDAEQEPDFSPRLAEAPRRTRRNNPRLNQAAEAIGTALGRAVSAARETSRQGDGWADETKPAAQHKVLRVRERTSETLDEVRDSSARVYEDARARAAEIIENARRWARQRADEYPLQIIAAAAGLGFLAGALLRIWRSRRV